MIIRVCCIVIIDKCGGLIISTEMWCLGNDTKEMWTFNVKQTKCEIVKVDTCNRHGGNIYENERDCKTRCASK